MPFPSAPGRMNLCTTVTESDIARGKNALKASLVAQLNGVKCIPHVCHVARTIIPAAQHDWLSLQERLPFVTTSAGTS